MSTTEPPNNINGYDGGYIYRNTKSKYIHKYRNLLEHSSMAYHAQRTALNILPPLQKYGKLGPLFYFLT